MICIPITAPDNAAMLALLAQAASEPADLHELRLDALTERPAVEALVAASTRPVIATCRSRREGGAHDGDTASRLDVLRRAASAGAAYLDAEPADIPHLGEWRGKATLIVSLHDFDGTPRDLSAKVAELANLPADWVKFAVAAQTPRDNLAVFAAIAACPKPCIGIAMGEMGLPSRILGRAYGSKLTFGSLDPGRESAPGQPTSRELANLYRVRSITRETRVYGLLGNPVAQSAGYRLHNMAFRDIGADAVYIPFLAEDAADFLAAVPDAINLRGLSVTMPHKRAAMIWAGSCSPEVAETGAANTLVRTPTGWRAFNTDYGAVYDALMHSVEELEISASGLPALVLGAGGAARSTGLALSRHGCPVSVAARDRAKAERLAREMGWAVADYDGAWRGDWGVVANTTPVGMHPDVGETPFPAKGWRKGMVAFDAIYVPAETRFIREAAAAGARTVNGGEMFVRQADGQFRLWMDRRLPETAVDGYRNVP